MINDDDNVTRQLAPLLIVLPSCSQILSKYSYVMQHFLRRILSRSKKRNGQTAYCYITTNLLDYLRMIEWCYYLESILSCYKWKTKEILENYE
jgi:hypothetical protein